MATKHHSKEPCRALATAMFVCFISTILALLGSPDAAAQALLYDNTDHSWTGSRSGPRNIIWVGPEWKNFIDAQPFKLGEHDNVASVSIPMARNLSSTARGTIRLSVWNDNGRGFPGQEVGELGVLDIDSLTRLPFGTGAFIPAIPSVTFDTPIDDLVPGETHYVVIDYGGLGHIAFGDVLVGLGNDIAGTNRVGNELITSRNVVPPFEDGDWEPGSNSSHHFLQMSVTSSDEPYTSIVCPVDTIYRQNFTMGDDGQATTFMPQGWAFSDSARRKDFDGRDLTDEERLMNIDTRIFDTSITDSFPADRSLGRGTPLFNAGMPSDPDRALALGVTRTSQDAMLQLVAEVAGGEANSIQLQFDIEAWDAANSRDNPGEAAFNLALDLDTGDGFQQIMDLGQVSTGATLVPPAEDFVNGNDDAYRTSFDSGMLNAHLPEGSKLRVRWMADLEAETRGWVFGLDNVSLGMFAENILGDFDQDGILTANDIDLLSAELREPAGNLTFDINNDGQVNNDDHSHWVHDSNIANTYFGDSNLDGEFNSGDLVDVFKSGKYELAMDASWAEGDWNGDQRFDSGDLVGAFQDGGYEVGPRAAVSAVPEPSSAIVLAIGMIGIGLIRRKR